jgi:hypothetical protein
MAIVRDVLAKRKPGVSPEEYEQFEREVDYVMAGRLKTIVSYRTHRITATDARPAGEPWDYVERLESTDPASPTTRSWPRRSTRHQVPAGSVCGLCGPSAAGPSGRLTPALRLARMLLSRPLPRVRISAEAFCVRCAYGSLGGQHPSLADYVTLTGTKDGATASGGRSCCRSS